MLIAVPASGRTSADAKATYIIQFLQSPVVAYEGGVAGLKATKPAKGAKIDPDAAEVTRYVDHLKSTHDTLLEKVGADRKLYDYAYTFNGVAAKLTEAQAALLAKAPDVLNVTPEQEVTADTSSTPAFLGLSDSNGLWDQLGGPTGEKNNGASGAGENIVIGMLDSGIWPENPSFSDRDPNGKLVYSQFRGWKASCSPETEQWDSNLCNKKLMSARYYNASWGGDAGMTADRPWEFNSPHDYRAHGTHTTSIAAGNYGVQPTGAAAAFGPISGIAPRARIAVYKVLWSDQNATVSTGRSGDFVAAIDQAVADGVDVINFSISGTSTNFADPVEIAFLFAADAGVFVAESAGNDGPTTSTVAHPSPWATTVAAGTHNRNGTGSVTLGNGVTYTGASVATPVASSPLIDSTAAGLPGADPTRVALCYGKVDNAGVAVLDPAKVAGKIVLCDRGVTGRVNKSLAVQEAGGVGMILVNVAPGSINADFHSVPTVHLPDTDRAALKAYAAGIAPTATINASTLTYTDPAPFTASFSSRGPLLAGGGDVLKPDVIAPGQDILAAVSPAVGGLNFNLFSGTSMSSPHVAGLGALLKQAHPDWSPMAIKSALMTTGGDILDAPNTNPLVIFRQGAGHVKPNNATNPGLVFDSGFNDWLAFLCGTTSVVAPASCTTLQGAGYSTDASDMNVASIAIGDLAGGQTVTRKVRNVGSASATYAPSVAGMNGITTTVAPSSLTLLPGQVGTFTVSFLRTTATVNAYVGGQLTWSDGTHNVRIPMVVRPVALAAPVQVTGTGGPISYNVKFGFTGPFTAEPRGLVPATASPGTVADDPTDTFAPGGPGTTSFDVVIPAGTTYARFSLFNEFTDGDDDLDLSVYRGATRVGASGGGTSAEEVNLVNPPADTYKVWVHGFATDGPDANFTLFHWVLGSTAAGSMAVAAPATATTGATGAIDLTFSGLAPATKYLGSVAYGGSTGLPNPTIVRVDTP